MAAKKSPPNEHPPMSPDDPRLPLKVRRLQEARSAIATLLTRQPRLETDPEFEEWENTVHTLLLEVFGASGYLLRFKQLTIRPISYSIRGGRAWYADPQEAWQTGLAQAEKILAEAIEEAEYVSGHASSNTANSAPSPRPRGNKVFVVHGHDDAAKEAAARYLEKLGLEAVILHERPSGGRTIMEKLEHYGDVDFAVVLLTPDDVGASAAAPANLKARARQNVILELGYFVGRLGRDKVCALHKGDVELPSDILGVIYVPMDAAGSWRFLLGKELRQAGFNVDLNAAL